MVGDRRKRCLCLIISIIFMISSSISIMAQEISVHGEMKDKINLDEIAINKIDPEITKAFEKSEYVGVLIDLKEEVDTEEVEHAEYMKYLSRSVNTNNGYYIKEAKSYAVVNALKNTAKSSQEGILKYLEGEKESGHVKELNSFYIMNVIYMKANEEVIKNISYREEVKYIHLDKEIEIQVDEVDELQLNSNSDNIAWGVKQVGAPQVWNELGINGSGVVVGVMDSGMDWQHEALKTKWRGYDPLNPDNPNPVGNWFDASTGENLPHDNPNSPHGTHVTGTIVGESPNGEHIIGVAPGAKWIGARIFDDAGSSRASWIISAAEWMIAPNGDPSLAPDIINNSWGAGMGLDEWFRPMVKAWRSAGILPIFSAGNSKDEQSTPESINNPSNYPESFAVAATDKDNKRGGFSCQGPGPYDEVKPDISAPGVNVYSSVLGGYEGGWNGTSMAAPHVAGVAALLISANQSLTPDQLENLMVVTATPLTDEQYTESPNYGYGVGLVNAYAAVSTISSGIGTIKGRVLKEGNDLEAPEIIHDPLREAYEMVDLQINALVNDNICVSEVEVVAKSTSQEEWVTFPMSKIGGDYVRGSYRIFIPGMFIGKEDFEYKIKAIDFGGHIVETDVFKVILRENIKPDQYEMDFTDSPAGWSMTGDWQWGEPVVGPETFEGNLIGTNLHGNYSDNSDSIITMPPIDLSNSSEASLRFDHWYEVEKGLDRCQIAISTNGGTYWDILAEYGKEDSQWREAVVDLSEYCGLENPIIIGFGFFSDETSNHAGWYIDNVKIVGRDINPPGAPQNLQYKVSPVGVEISWDPIEDGDLDKYIVCRTTTSQAISIMESKECKIRDKDVQYGENYIYKVESSDIYGNIGEPSEEVLVEVPPYELRYFSDFEENNGGFITGGENNTWEWDTPNYAKPDNPIEVPKPGAFSGSKMWGTNIINGGTYEDNTNSWIESPEIDLTGLRNGELNFYEWYSTENRYDKCYIKVSTDDGITWNDLIDNYSGGEYPYAWELRTISLDEYVGNKIKLRFVLTSDSMGNYSGWHIDDVRVTGNAEGNSLSDLSYNEYIEEEIQIKEKDSYENIGFNAIRNHYESSIELNNTETGLPLEAVITIVETNKTVKSSSWDGSFTILHSAAEEGRDLTLRVESYGYYPMEEKIKLYPNEDAFKEFKMKKIPMGIIRGRLVDERTKKPIEGAEIKIKEDYHVKGVTTDSNGEFLLENVLEGQWTMVATAEEYYIKEVELQVTGNEELNENFELKPFISCNKEIAYDDGTPEEFKAFDYGSKGWAIKMTPEKSGKLVGAKVYLSDTWPSPEGNGLRIAVHDSDSQGRVGNLIFTTDVIEVEKGGWSYIDLSEYNFKTDRDFYLSYIQAYAGGYSAGIGIDTSTPSANRTYYHFLLTGKIERVEDGYGNLLLRADMQYEFNVPTIDLLNESYTNKESITITGNVNTNSLVRVYVNGNIAIEEQIHNNAYEIETPLVEGENIITVTADAGNGETDSSQSVSIIKDTQLPVLEVATPLEGLVINKEVMEIKGTVEDDNLHEVLVNGNRAIIEENGEFYTKIALDNGENTIIIRAGDKAGNYSTIERKVIVNANGPTITDIKPDLDVEVSAGSELKVSFRSNTIGGIAEFKVAKEFTLSSSEFNGIKMTEIEPGYYEGTWVIPQNIEFRDANIYLKLTDAVGSTSQAMAYGKVSTKRESGENSILIENVEVKEQLGGVLVKARIRNVSSTPQSPTLIISVSDLKGRVVNISTANISELLAGKSIVLGSGFNKPKKGKYSIKVFVWDSIEDMNPLGSPQEQIVEFKTK